MKLLYISIQTLAIVCLFTLSSNAQCNTSELSDNCIVKLNSEYNYIKSFPINGQGGLKSHIKFAYIFAKGTDYMIKLCSLDGKSTDGIVTSLFDQKKNLVSESKYSDKLFSTIVFPCQSTGLYTIQFSFEKESKHHCGVAVLGFKR